MYTCSLKSEIAAIAFAMEWAADHYTWLCKQTLSEEKLFILIDCNAAINSVLQRSKLHFFYTTTARVRSTINILAEMRVRPVLAWSPSHSHIPLNNKVDSLAKIGIRSLPPVQNNTIAFGTGKSIILKQVVLSWQLHWNRSTTGRSTHELISKVDTKMIFPKNRCVSISYVRLLLNDTTLKDHQPRLGLAVTKVCDCNQGIEDEYHFLLECCRYKEIRNQLIHIVQNTWSEAGLTGSLTWSVELLLMPSCLDIFTNKQCQVLFFWKSCWILLYKLKL